MSIDLKLDLEKQHYFVMDGEKRFEQMNQGEDWDIPGFDLDDATELFDAFQNADYVHGGPELDFDFDLPLWNDVSTNSIYTDGEVSVQSLSPAHTLSSALSPGSTGSFSPYSVQDEALSPQSQPSPVSVCSDLSGISEVPVKKSIRRSNQTSRARPSAPVKRPIHCGPKVCIQPKPVIAAVPVATAPLQAKTIIIQPVQNNLLPVIKPTPINIQPAPPQAHPIVLSQPSQLLQISSPQTVTGNVLTIPALERPVSVAPPPLVPVTLKASSDDDSKFSQRQQRMIKNRESASLSRKKKKDYLFSLEARLKMALSENEVLKSENGNLKKQLQGLLNENSALKATAPKRRAVCLMVIVVFVVLNIGPLSNPSQDSSGLEVVPVQHSRHLLAFSPEEDVVVERSSEPLGGGHTGVADSGSEDKALMVMKDSVYIRPPPPCQPLVNRTKCIELAHELRGWVHRHEVQQTKSRRMSNRNHKPTRTILKSPAKDAGTGHIMTVHYTEPTEDRLPGSELQVYYAPRHTYSDFFDELNRRGDTFYVVSFRRDHLLLPATHHNKGRRPKMSVVLPAMNINDSIIRDQDHEVMMQIDCEVTDTRIINIRSSTIPPLLRVNRTETFYQRGPTDHPAAAPVGALVGAV